MQKRKAGFIRNYSQRQPTFAQESSEFSYFKVKPKVDEDEFSPYKFEEEDEEDERYFQTIVSHKTLSKPPLPKRSIEKVKTVSNLADRVKADRLVQKMRQNATALNKPSNDKGQNLQQNIGNIRNKIQKLDEVLRQLKMQKEDKSKGEQIFPKKHRKFEEDSSSLSSSEDQESRVQAIPSPQIQHRNIHEMQRLSEQQQQHHTFDNQEENHYDSEEQVEKEEIQDNLIQPHQSLVPQHNVITFNSRLKDQPPLQIKSYSSSSGDEDQSEQTEQPIVQTIPNRLPPSRSNKQFYHNKGGVCFEVDVKQFTAPIPPSKEVKQVFPQKKKTKVDQRNDILRRRQAAKAYDRMCRRALFSPQY